MRKISEASPYAESTLLFMRSCKHHRQQILTASSVNGSAAMNKVFHGHDSTRIRPQGHSYEEYRLLVDDQGEIVPNDGTTKTLDR